MASLLVEGDVVTVSLSVAEKVEALHGDVSVPRAAVLSARVVPDGMEEVHGLKGAGLPGAVMVGTWRDGESVTFAVCHGRQPACSPARFQSNVPHDAERLQLSMLRRPSLSTSIPENECRA